MNTQANPNILLLLFSGWMLICVMYMAITLYSPPMEARISNNIESKEPKLPAPICQCNFTINYPLSPAVKCPLNDKAPKHTPPTILPDLPIVIPDDCAEKYGPRENRRVYTYHQIIPGFRNDSDLLQLWEVSWRANCWDPVVLNENHAMLHDNYQPLMAKLEQLPTVNPKQYELSCYARYLAMSAIGGGIMVDNDMINLSFKPNEMTNPLPKRFACFDGAIASMNYGTKEEYDRVINYMANYQLQPNDKYSGKNHTSDMIILLKMLADNLVDLVTESPARANKIKHMSSGWMSKVKRWVGLSVNKKHLARLALLLEMI